MVSGFLGRNEVFPNDGAGTRQQIEESQDGNENVQQQQHEKDDGSEEKHEIHTQAEEEAKQNAPVPQVQENSPTGATVHPLQPQSNLGEDLQENVFEESGDVFGLDSSMQAPFTLKSVLVPDSQEVTNVPESQPGFDVNLSEVPTITATTEVSNQRSTVAHGIGIRVFSLNKSTKPHDVIQLDVGPPNMSASDQRKAPTQTIKTAQTKALTSTNSGPVPPEQTVTKRTIQQPPLPPPFTPPPFTPPPSAPPPAATTCGRRFLAGMAKQGFKKPFAPGGPGRASSAIDPKTLTPVKPQTSAAVPRVLTLRTTDADNRPRFEALTKCIEFERPSPLPQRRPAAPAAVGLRTVPRCNLANKAIAIPPPVTLPLTRQTGVTDAAAENPKSFTPIQAKQKSKPTVAKALSHVEESAQWSAPLPEPSTNSGSKSNTSAKQRGIDKGSEYGDGRKNEDGKPKIRNKPKKKEELNNDASKDKVKK